MDYNTLPLYLLIETKRQSLKVNSDQPFNNIIPLCSHDN